MAQGKVDTIPRLQETKETLHRGFGSSSLSLGLASTGLFLLPPIQYASIPALIYMGAPSARHAYDILYEQGRPSRALVETAVLAICLGGGFYLVGSLGFWLYYLGQLAQHKRKITKKESSVDSFIPRLAHLRDGAKAVVVPIETLQRGDEVLVKTSEVIPADGIICDGAAWIQSGSSTDNLFYQLKQIGDQVMAMDIVIAGHFSLRVQKPPCAQQVT